MGCWADTESRALEIIDWEINDPYVVLECFRLARDYGYRVFAVQYEVQCFGGADNNAYKKYGESTSCNEKGTGGEWANQVYRIKDYMKGKFDLDSSKCDPKTLDHGVRISSLRENIGRPF